MRSAPGLAMVLGIVLVIVPMTAYAQQNEPQEMPAHRELGYADGTQVCFRPSLQIGSFIIVGGRCYNPYLVRDGARTYLGFGPAGQPLLRPGQVVYLNTQHGNRILKQLTKLVPLSVQLNVPVGTIQYQPTQVVSQGRFVVLTVVRGNQRAGLQLAER